MCYEIYFFHSFFVGFAFGGMSATENRLDEIFRRRRLVRQSDFVAEPCKIL
jgi:hypothetical protein